MPGGRFLFRGRDVSGFPVFLYKNSGELRGHVLQSPHRLIVIPFLRDITPPFRSNPTDPHSLPLCHISGGKEVKGRGGGVPEARGGLHTMTPNATRPCPPSQGRPAHSEADEALLFRILRGALSVLRVLMTGAMRRLHKDRGAQPVGLSGPVVVRAPSHPFPAAVCTPRSPSGKTHRGFPVDRSTPKG